MVFYSAHSRMGVVRVTIVIVSLWVVKKYRLLMVKLAHAAPKGDSEIR